MRAVAGCNAIVAEYDVTATGYSTKGDRSQTLMYCGKENMTNEGKLSDVLDSSANWRVENEFLVSYDKLGKVVSKFIRRKK